MTNNKYFQNFEIKSKVLETQDFLGIIFHPFQDLKIKSKLSGTQDFLGHSWWITQIN